MITRDAVACYDRKLIAGKVAGFESLIRLLCVGLFTRLMGTQAAYICSSFDFDLIINICHIHTVK